MCTPQVWSFLNSHLSSVSEHPWDAIIQENSQEMSTKHLGSSATSLENMEPQFSCKIMSPPKLKIQIRLKKANDASKKLMELKDFLINTIRVLHVTKIQVFCLYKRVNLRDRSICLTRKFTTMSLEELPHCASPPLWKLNSDKNNNNKVTLYP